MQLISEKPRQRSLAGFGSKSTVISAYGTVIIRIGLGLVLLLIGGLKFTPEEAMGIQPLVAHSPLFAWLYGVLSIQQVSNIFGTLEIITGTLILTRPFNPLLSAIGSAMAVATFASTTSFILSTPGIWSMHYGFPALSDAGAFLIKDITLLGAAVYTLGEALSQTKSLRKETRP